ncbi:MAG: ATP-binding protein [Elusimicrobiota bacterium]
MKSNVGQKRNQYRYIFWGTLLGYSGGITNFLPTYGIDIYPIGNLTSIFYSLSIAYALITIKTINLQYLFRKIALESLTFMTIVLLSGFLIIPFGISLHYVKPGIFIALIIIITITITNLLYAKLRNIYFKVFFRYSNIFNRDIQIWIKEIRKYLKRNTLIEDTMNMLNKMYMIDKGAIKIAENGKELFLTSKYIFNNNSKVNIEKSAINDNPGDDLFWDYAKENDRILLKDDIEKIIEIGKPVTERELKLYCEMNSKGYSAIIPLRTAFSIAGYILLGNKLSGNMYDKDEIDALHLIKDAMETSLHNIENIDIIKNQEKQIEEELQKANKLESLGLLAGGIAHDFNNMLTIIMGNISLAKASAKKGSELNEVLMEAGKSAQKAVGLANQLSTFSKGGEPKKKLVSISEQLRDLAIFSLRGSNVKCEFSIQDDLWLVDVDEGQFSRVINNIIINGSQAMPTGGIIEINAKNVIYTHENNILKREGNFIKISIKDHGPGIPKEFLNKIFDPYFTTKESGTGLGLAIIYSIIKKHGGYIDVESEIGIGTVFHIYLPASIDSRSYSTTAREDIIYKGNGKVLVMDDEVSIQLLLKRVLTSLGYTVVYCNSGIEAIEIIKKERDNNNGFDLVIMDLTIQGGMGGKAANSIIKQLSPNIKTIVSSGYSSDDVMAFPEKYGFNGIIAKPYSVEEISKVIKEVLSK